MGNINYQKLFNQLCKEKKTDIHLSFAMPKGCENANGMYNPLIKTLFINKELLKDYPDYEQAYYLFHEFRHAEQHAFPERFNALIRKAINYDIAYNGQCSKLVNGQWLSCLLPGDENYFIALYLSQPHEVDANEYAYEQVKKLYGDSKGLKDLYSYWVPDEIVTNQDLEKAYAMIDSLISK